jgi:hypothetical protein
VVAEGDVTLDDFPLWSVWMRDYSYDGPEHWVLFVVEAHGRATHVHDLEVTARVIASQAPPGCGTSEPGSVFRFTPARGSFPTLVKRLA